MEGETWASDVKLWAGDVVGEAESPLTAARVEKIRVGFDTCTADVERLRAEGGSVYIDIFII